MPMNFPTAGETLNGTKVISSDATEGDILKYEVVLPKEPNKTSSCYS